MKAIKEEDKEDSSSDKKQDDKSGNEADDEKNNSEDSEKSAEKSDEEIEKKSQVVSESKIDSRAARKKADQLAKEKTPEKAVEEEKEEELEEHNEAAGLMYIEGILTIMSEKGGGQFGDKKNYYTRFFYKGQFVAFFNKQDSDSLAVFYIKVRNIAAIEDFFNTDPTQVYVEYNDGKRDKRIVLVIPDIKVKDKWVDSFTQFKDQYEDYNDRQDADYGKTEPEMKYQLTEMLESDFIRKFVDNKTQII